MTWIWLVQLSLDVALILTVMALWRPERRRNEEEKAQEEKIRAALAIVESRSNHLEKEILRYRKLIEEQLNLLQVICSQARQILEKGQDRVTTFAPTIEEAELLGTGATAAPWNVVTPSEKIPTVTELEETRRRHGSELRPDLKTILRDQLA